MNNFDAKNYKKPTKEEIEALYKTLKFITYTVIKNEDGSSRLVEKEVKKNI